MLQIVKEQVTELLGQDTSGHGMDHVMRVYNLALKFADQEKANSDIVGLAALLHDVDDYKLFGVDHAQQLSNAQAILAQAKVDSTTSAAVLEVIKHMGYGKSLKGIRPTTLEGQVVSDADMCDAMGAIGIVRSIVYAVSGKADGTIFNPDLLPTLNITAEQYNGQGGTTHSTDTAINHFFEKLLTLQRLMLTDAGRQEATQRHQIMVDFLHHYFQEAEAPEWTNLLNNFLATQDKATP